MAMPVPADGAEVPQDEEIYDPVTAVANEAKGKKGFPFRVDDDVFRMKSPQQLGRKTMKRIELLGNDDNVGGVQFMDAMFEALLGAEQFARFDEVADLSVAELQNLLEKSTEYYGIDLPESPASTRSSKTKRKR
jgi:hypothetical protein